MRSLSFRAAALTGAAALVSAVVASSLGAQSLKGSLSSVQSMHSHAVRNGFSFYSTSSDVREALRNGQLVRLTGNADYEVLSSVEFPYAKDAAKLFVERLSSQYKAACGERLVVTSATRPTDVKLANGSPNSVHPTGMAIDLRKPQKSKCLSWLRSTLVALEKNKVIEATEESRPPHFHVAVYPAPYTNYVVAMTRSANLAETRLSTVAVESNDVEVVSYAVRKGDSLWKIATLHDTSVQAIQELNRMRSSTIHPGQVIRVPNVAGSGPH